VVLFRLVALVIESHKTKAANRKLWFVCVSGPVEQRPAGFVKQAILNTKYHWFETFATQKQKSS